MQGREQAPVVPPSLRFSPPLIGRKAANAITPRAAPVINRGSGVAPSKTGEKPFSGWFSLCRPASLAAGVAVA